jgi:hypothetical protein
MADLASVLPYTIGGKPKTMPWDAAREQQFQAAMQTQSPYADWSRQFRQKYGEQPNLNDPQYNYRLAYALGAQPQAYAHDPGMMHWSSATPVAPYAEPAYLKGPDHPTRWMETFMRRYGVDPFDASSQQMSDAMTRGIVPMRSDP